MRKIVFGLFFILFFFFGLMAQVSWGCACGCGIFDVGTGDVFPSNTGGEVFLNYDFMNQNHNWSRDSKASNDDNSDKKIRTNFITAGGQYMFNRSWGIKVELPYDERYFKTTDEDTSEIVAFKHWALGDLRLQGIYTGFSPDMSTGVTFGVKIPTGDWKYSNFDRDTQIGSGSTDVLLGAYHRGALTANNSFSWFIEDQLDQPAMIQGGYRPGTEDDAALGVYYNGFMFGSTMITPVAQVIGSYRSKDRGWAANSADSGYERVLLSPGLELDFKRFAVYSDVELPVYEHVNGNQLVANVLFKLNVSYKF